MFSDPVSFNGGTRVEVIAVLANCGRDTDKARRALVTWIRHKQEKGRTTEHILTKLRDIESKFIKDTTLHSAFRDARAETLLPRAPDLPLPYHVKRNSDGQIPESVSYKTGHYGPVSSSLVELPMNLTQQASPSFSPLRLSRGSSQMSEPLLEKSNMNRHISFAQGVPRIPQYRSPRIQIPRDRPLQPAPSSPVTSSPEEPEVHFRYRYISQPVGPPSRYNDLVTPVSASPPELPWSPISHDQAMEHHRRLSHGLVSPPPLTRIQIPRSRSQRSASGSPLASSPEESELHSGRYRPMSQSIGSVSPGRRRATPPRTYPPEVPLPPIPSDDQGMDSDGVRSKKSSLTEEPPTPLRSPVPYSSTPIRPMPIQPIPSPVPGSDESEPTDAISVNSLRQNWKESSADLPSDVVVRQDSPVYVFQNDHATPTGITPPPPYVDQLDTYFPPDMSTIGNSLDRAVKECGGSPEVRLVVSKCVEFSRGYEPPYWQTRLQACGLHAEATNRLVDEMCKQVDWAASFRRAA